MRFDIVSIYSEQTNPVFNQLFLNGRQRFGDQLLLSRADGVRATVKAMKSGRPFYYLPDMNPRRRDAIFVPFFGVSTATITGLPRLAKAAGRAGGAMRDPHVRRRAGLCGGNRRPVAGLSDDGCRARYGADECVD
jgi:lauroyl/myristoyl acyltransferase